MSKGRKGRAKLSMKTQGRAQNGHRRTIIDIPVKEIEVQMEEVPVPGPSLFPNTPRDNTARIEHLEGLVQSLHTRLGEALGRLERRSEDVSELRQRIDALEEAATKPTHTRKLRPLDDTDRHVYAFMCKHAGLKFSTGSLASNLEMEGPAVSDALDHLMAHKLVDRSAAKNLGHAPTKGGRVGAWNYFVPKKDN